MKVIIRVSRELGRVVVKKNFYVQGKICDEFFDDVGEQRNDSFAALSALRRDAGNTSAGHDWSAPIEAFRLECS